MIIYVLDNGKRYYLESYASYVKDMLVFERVNKSLRDKYFTRYTDDDDVSIESLKALYKEPIRQVEFYFDKELSDAAEAFARTQYSGTFNLCYFLNNTPDKQLVYLKNILDATLQLGKALRLGDGESQG